MPEENAAPLCGRDDELRRLEDALATACAGAPSLVLIDGPGGIGKTALIRRFVRDQDGVRVLWASGDLSERGVPYAVVDQLVRRARPDDGATSLIGNHPAHYTGVGLTILDVLSELQRTGPIIVVIDDAHWADPPSLRALLFAVRRLVADAVLVILAARTEDLHVLPEGFARTADSRRITLTPLGLEETRTLARDRDLPLSAHAVRRLHELSAGVPLHLCALLDDLTARGDFTQITTPPSFAALIVGRLSECDPDSRRLVEAAAVLGRNATVDEVARVAGIDGGVLEALGEPVDRQLIRVTKRSIEFTHPLVRSAIHEAIAPARLAELHTAAAAGAEEPGLALLHRARAAVAPDARIAAELEAAGAREAAEGNWLRAADFSAEAAELSTARADRERRVLDSVSALCDAGDLVAALAMVPQIRAFRVEAERDHVLGRLALSQLALTEAEERFEAAWRACPSENTRLRMRIATELAYCAYFRVDARTQLVWAERAAALASPDAAPRIRALALALNGRLDEGLADLDRSLSAARLAEPRMVHGRLRMIDDDLAGARDDLAGARLAAVHGPSRAAAMSLGRLSWLEYLDGHWDIALTYAEQGLAACVDRTDFAQITAIRAPAVLVLAGRGQWDEAEQHLRAMLSESPGAPLPAVYTAFAGARLAAARADAEAVLSALAPILALRTREAVDEPNVWPWQDSCADALVDLGRLEEAERFLEPHEALASLRGRASMVGRLARSRARLEAARGHDDRARDAFLRSAQALAAVPLPYELALTELEHGRFLRRRRQRRAAVEVLANARDRFAALGAARALDACERELQASGLVPKRPAAKGVVRLTPQEQTVAGLVVAGMTNREIAGELLVSTKTIEVHLTSVYAKLEVRSRAELRARARRGELASLERVTA